MSTGTKYFVLDRPVTSNTKESKRKHALPHCAVFPRRHCITCMEKKSQKRETKDII
jgi:hypothetical protein